MNPIWMHAWHIVNCNRAENAFAIIEDVLYKRGANMNKLTSIYEPNIFKIIDRK